MKQFLHLITEGTKSLGKAVKIKGWVVSKGCMVAEPFGMTVSIRHCLCDFELFTLIWTNQAYTCSSLSGNEFTIFIGYIKPCTVRASRLMSGRPLAGGNTSSLRKRLEAGLPPPRTRAHAHFYAKATLSHGHRLLYGDPGKGDCSMCP